MGPVTRSSHRNQANTKNVLADKTNMPRISERNKNKEKQCVYSHSIGEENTHEGLIIYEFDTNSPPRKVVKKRKPRNKKHLSDDEIIFPISKIENVKYNTRQGHTISAENKNKMKNVRIVSFSSENNGNIMSIGGEKQSINSKENKENISAANKNKMKNVSSVSYLSENNESIMSKGEEKESTSSEENKENISAGSENKMKIVSSVPFPSENNGNVTSIGGEKESTNSEENKENISAENKNKTKNVSSVSFPSGNNGYVISIRGEKESTNSKENKKNISTVKEIECMVNYMNATAKPLDTVDTNTRSSSNSCVFAENIQQDLVCIPPDSENKENYSDTSFRDSTCSFGFSPIQHENKDFFVTKRLKKRKYCVEDFTIENCFGFDEESDEMKSTEHSSVLYAVSSTPNHKNNPTRPKMQMSQILLPAQLNSAPSKTYISNSTNTKDNSVDPLVAFSLPVAISNPDLTQNNQCDDVTSTKLLQVTSAKLPRFTSTKLPRFTSTKLPRFTSTKLPRVTSTKFPRVTSTKLSQVISTKLPQATSTEIQVTSAKMPQVTSTVISNDFPELFGDNLVERHFNKPPRRSYERKAQMHCNYQTEAESESEDEIFNTERNKSSNKRKVKEDKKFHKWAADVSAEFEEVESFQLHVE